MLQNEILPGDVLLFYPSSLIGHIVAWATDSPYCHAAMYVANDEVAELREFFGGRILSISSYADDTIDVFRADCPIPVKIEAVLNMRSLMSERYSFLHGIAAWMRRCIPKRVRRLKWVRKWFCSESDHLGYNCSQAISKAYRESRFDLCQKIPDWATTPGDLARKKRLRFVGRLDNVIDIELLE